MLLTLLLLIPLIFTDKIKVHFDTVLIVPPPPEKQVLEVTHYKASPPTPKFIEPPKPVVAPSSPKPELVQSPKPKPLEPPKVAEVKLFDVIQ